MLPLAMLLSVTDVCRIIRANSTVLNFLLSWNAMIKSLHAHAFCTEMSTSSWTSSGNPFMQKMKRFKGGRLTKTQRFEIIPSKTIFKPRIPERTNNFWWHFNYFPRQSRSQVSRTRCSRGWRGVRTLILPFLKIWPNYVQRAPSTLRDYIFIDH